MAFRIEYVKNQINLVYSLFSHNEIPIVFVGHPVEKGYFDKLKEISSIRGNVYFIDNIPQNEINLFYKYADIHVLLSLRESPGLVSLETALEKCPIVVTTKQFSPVDTYFANCPYVVNPLDISSVEKIVLQAYKERKITEIDLGINHGCMLQGKRTRLIKV